MTVVSGDPREEGLIVEIESADADVDVHRRGAQPEGRVVRRDERHGPVTGKDGLVEPAAAVRLGLHRQRAVRLVERGRRRAHDHIVDVVTVVVDDVPLQVRVSARTPSWTSTCVFCPGSAQILAELTWGCAGALSPCDTSRS